MKGTYLFCAAFHNVKRDDKQIRAATFHSLTKQTFQVLGLQENSTPLLCWRFLRNSATYGVLFQNWEVKENGSHAIYDSGVLIRNIVISQQQHKYASPLFSLEKVPVLYLHPWLFCLHWIIIRVMRGTHENMSIRRGALGGANTFALVKKWDYSQSVRLHHTGNNHHSYKGHTVTISNSVLL